MKTVTLVSALLATAAAVAASAAMAIEYARSRLAHALCWAVSLGLFAVASSVLAAGALLGWSSGLFRVYYLVGGVLVVPWMALGATWLFGSLRLARFGTCLTVGLTVVAVLVTVPAKVAAPGPGMPELREALGGAAASRVLAAIANAGGTVVALSLLLRASSTFRRKGVLPNKARGAALISVGITAAAAGGVLAAVGHVACLAPSLAVGAILLFVGFRLWNRAPRRPRTPRDSGVRRG